jgi:hypothetical protein
MLSTFISYIKLKFIFWQNNFVLEKCGKNGLYGLGSGSGPIQFDKLDPDKNRPYPQHCVTCINEFYFSVTNWSC